VTDPYDPTLPYTERRKQFLDAPSSDTQRQGVPAAATTESVAATKRGEDDTLGERLLMMGPEIAASIIGARGGQFAAPRHPVPLEVRALGAGAGGAAGRALTQPFYNRNTELTPEERLNEILMAGGMGALGEGLGSVVEKGARAAGTQIGGGVDLVRGRLAEAAQEFPHIGPVLERLGPSGYAAGRGGAAMAEASMAQEMLRERGLSLSADQVAPYMDPGLGKNTLDTLGGVLKQVGGVKTNREINERYLSNEINQWVKGLGARDPRAAGEAASAAVRNSPKEHKKAVAAAWQLVDNDAAATGTAEGVNTSRMWDLAKAQFGRADMPFRPGLAATARKIQLLGTPAEKQAFDFLGLLKEETTSQPGVPTRDVYAGTTIVPGKVTSERQPFLTFSEAQQVRGALNGIANFPDQYPGVDAGFVRKQLTLLDEEMEAAGKRISEKGGPLYENYLKAQGLSKMGYTMYNNSIVRAWLSNMEPERMFADIIDKRSPTRISMMKRMVDDGVGQGNLPEDTWEKVTGPWFDAVLSKATKDPVHGTIDADVALREINSYREWGALDEMFPGAQGSRGFDDFENMLKTLRAAQQTSKEGGQLALTLMQFRGMWAIGSGGAGYYTGAGPEGSTILAASGLVFGPKAMARLMRDHTFVTNLTKGFRNNFTTVAGSRALGQVLTRAAQLKAEDGLDDLLINQDMLDQVDPVTGEVKMTVGEVALANRPQRVRVNPAAQNLETLFGAARRQP
jgi:hypothetical protein